MVFVLSLFLFNSLCAFVPCRPFYAPPVPVPLEQNVFSSKPFDEYGFNTEETEETGFDASMENPIVETLTGAIRGFRMKTIRARDIFAFTAIPYAEPPIGSLRFRSPVPKKRWSNVRSAAITAPFCLQISALQKLQILGTEDCLYLNVYTPKLPRTGKKPPKLPVMVYIHGGSFAFGGGSLYGPSYLLDRDVILVTLNYRLSSLGFLSTGDEAAAGNWGMKDQRLALEWVNKNAGVFGGDSSRITLFGQSAGAVSVHLHMLSKRSKGLFHAGISQSGSAFCFWAVRKDSVDYTYRLAARLRCPVNESRLTVECLRRTDAHLIAYSEASLPEFTLFPGVFFGPIVEAPGPDAFLESWPKDLYKRNEVEPIPWMTGGLAIEGNGLAFLTYLYPTVIQDVDRRWSELAHMVLDIRPDDFRKVSEATDAIRKFYFGDKPINFYTRLELAKMYGDRLITTGVHTGLKQHPHIAPTYGYFFNYSGRYGTADTFGLRNEDWGISHDDDLMYLMNSTSYAALKVGEPEYEMSEFLVNLWVNFATLRKPLYTTDDGELVDFWAPIHNASDIQLVQIDGDYPKMIPEPYLDRINFWEKYGLSTDSYVGP